MEQIPWYYMWSKSYHLFYELLKDSVKEPEFTMTPIEVEQSRFDSELYQIQGEHFWQGSLIKVDTLLECLKTATDEGKPYILFTDIDIIVKPGVFAGIKPYMDDQYDMVFLKEGDHMNIGFLLLRVIPDVIAFWQQIRSLVQESGGLDQSCVNQTLPGFNGKHTSFDNQIFACTNTWDRSKPFVVLQLLCSRFGRDQGVEKECNMAEKIFSAAQLVNMEPYMKYVDPSIIPFIYKVQEIIVGKTN